MKNKGGRPTKYFKELPDVMLEYFKKHLPKNGKVTIKSNLNFPTFAMFAALNDFHIDSLHEYKKKYPKFSEAYKKCQAIQEAIIITGGLKEKFNAQYAKFVSKACCKMKEEEIIDHKSSDGSMTPSFTFVEYKQGEYEEQE